MQHRLSDLTVEVSRCGDFGESWILFGACVGSGISLQALAGRWLTASGIWGLELGPYEL